MIALRRENLKGFARRFTYTRAVGAMDAKPGYADVVEGAWWDGSGDTSNVCASEEAAKTLKLKPGDRIEWSVGARKLSTNVACIVKIDPIHLMGRLDFLFDRRMLEGLPVIYYGSVRMNPDDVARMQVQVYQKFPTVTVMNVADVLKIIQDVVNQISIQVRFISAFAILAGVIILASSVAGSRFRRVREVVILKTLGASRARIANTFSVEFLILGRRGGTDGESAGAGVRGASC